VTELSLPHDLPAERAVLASCLVERDAILVVRGILGEPDFHLERHAAIYRAMLACVEQKTPPDLITVRSQLQLAGELQLAGGAAYLGELVAGDFTAVHAAHYAHLVARCARRRRVIEMAARLQAAAYDDQVDPDDLVETAEHEVSLERRIGSGREMWQAHAKDGAAYWSASYPPRPMVIEGFLPIGTTLLHGLPKTRKSWFALGCAYSVAAGGQALGQFQAMKGEALYIDLEMDDELIHERLRVLFPHQAPPRGVTFVTEWPAVGAGFLEQLDSYLQARPYTRLIILDTLIRVRPQSRSDDMYQNDANFLQPLTDFCGGRGVAMLLIHHSRKLGGGGDSVLGASGSTGLTGSVDNVLELIRRPDAPKLGTLKRQGRRIREDDDIPLRWAAETAQWNYQEREAQITPERALVLRLLRDRGAMKPKDIATVLNREEPSTRRLLQDMAKAGLVANAQGFYLVNDPESPEMA
jgi:hypothetical protein